MNKEIDLAIIECFCTFPQSANSPSSRFSQTANPRLLFSPVTPPSSSSVNGETVRRSI